MHNFAKLSTAVRKPFFRHIQKPVPCTYIGPGTVKKTGSIFNMMGVRKVLVITDSFLYSSGLLNGLLESMREQGVQYEVFDGVKPDPAFPIAEQAAAAGEGCGGVIAVGGGSVLDIAKAVSATMANHTTADKLVGLMKVKNAPVPFIAVPTTAGTGSETTIVSVLSDPKTHAKKTLIDEKLTPMFAILDPELTVGLPRSITANTAMDALTHALESYLSGYADEQTRRQARTAVRMIVNNLPVVMREPGNLEAREALLVGSFFAGLAFTRTYIGYVHAFAHTIGGKFGVPHGLANAVLLPHVMQDYLPVCQKEFAELAVFSGLTAESMPENERAQYFVDCLFSMNEECGVPARFPEFPADKINAVIDMAFKECHGVYPVPRYYSKAEARSLMEKVCCR